MPCHVAMTSRPGNLETPGQQSEQRALSARPRGLMASEAGRGRTDVRIPSGPSDVLGEALDIAVAEAQEITAAQLGSRSVLET